MELILFSFIAGILTVLSPCVLPVLPVVLGGSLSSKSKTRAVVIITSLAISIVVFTLLLKVSSAFINISPDAITFASAILIGIYGFSLLFPDIWERITHVFKIGNASQQALANASQKKGVLGEVLLGAALGPVFASCSPTYALILATVLPANFTLGLVYLIVYVAGMAVFLIAIALLGQRLTSKLKAVADPRSAFRKVLGAILILVAILLVTGEAKKIQENFLSNGAFNATNLELSLYSKGGSNTPGEFNVKEPYAAPEFTGISTWLNSEPLKMSELKGKVVLIDFWTYSCINCIRTLPYLQSWQDKYADDGLVIVGVHSPEFQFEKNPENVKKAISDYKLTYPTAMDNDFSTWRAYKNQFWPAKYFVDAEGNVRHTHFGEGDYNESEEIIRKLLIESGAKLDDSKAELNDKVPVSSEQSPETYLGYARDENFANEIAGAVEHDVPTTLNYSRELPTDYWSLNGKFQQNEENIDSLQTGNKLKYTFTAKDIYLVAGPTDNKTPATMKIRVNGEVQNLGKDANDKGEINVDSERLYHLVALPQVGKSQTLEIELTENTSLYAFTFGS